MNRKKNKIRTDKPQTSLELSNQHEMMGVVFLLAAVFVTMSLASFSPIDPVFGGLEYESDNLMGYVGAQLANALLSSLGLGSFILVAALLWAGVLAFTRAGISLNPKKLFGYLAFCLLGTTMCHLAVEGRHVMGRPPGGIVGEYSVALLTSLFSRIGTLVLVSAGLLLALIGVTGFSPLRTITWAGRGIQKTARALKVIGIKAFSELKSFSFQPKESTSKSTRDPKQPAAPRRNPQEPEIVVPTASHPPRHPGIQKEAGLSSVTSGIGRREPLLVVDTDEIGAKHGIEEGPKSSRWSFGGIDRSHEPEIVIPKNKPNETRHDTEEPPQSPVYKYQDFKLPDLDFLNEQQQTETVVEEEQLRKYARTLEQKLADYGVQGKVTKIMPGPVVTMYEYAPAPGIKVSKIAGLSNDLALALGAMSVRIIAPIPGRPVVGIEVSNKDRQTVYSKEIIGHAKFQRSRSKLALALGKDIEGNAYIADLNKMPHLLVAGATGTGKSVALNTMITSILYRATPEDVKFIMVDPKVLELSLYQDIPHLLLPVVTDPRKAQAALQWAVSEMERRIRILYTAGVRSLDGYNKKVELQENKSVESQPAEAAAGQPAMKKVMIIDKTAGASTADPELEDEDFEPIEIGDAPLAEAAESQEDEGVRENLQKLPHIVIVIDELADLMMSSGREVETAIARIAQKARAAGIHLIIATQRPSVNVITGLIKANLPARISFRVASKTDSRTILDQNGAETLLGNGDMLFHPPTTSVIERIHGALITEEEIMRVVDHLKAQAQPVFDESILAHALEEEEKELLEDEDQDELYDLAVQIVAEMGQASTSMIQRKLRIGYNRAARLIERMEREGIVGPPDGSRPREVLVQNHITG